MASKFAKSDIPSIPTRYNNEEIRIVLVGKTGVGKSASGNTILGEEKFESKFSFESLTAHCAKASGEVDGQKVSIIDTPGLFDTSIEEKKNREEIVQCISYASPGPHIFLVVIKLGRFTKEEKDTVQKIQKNFGEEANKYSMVLFTHGDLLKGEPIEELLKESEDLQELVAKYNGQYHVFNNELKDGSQVRELLQKIKNITEKNGGSHYTTEMFQAAEKIIEEEQQRILKEKEEQMLREREALTRQIEEKYEKQIKEMKDDMVGQEKLRAACDGEIEERMSMEQEEMKETIEEKYEKQMREMKDEMERKERLMVAREREIEERMKEMQRKQEKQARQEAEESVPSRLLRLLERAFHFFFK